jgi:hypothetical protein
VAASASRHGNTDVSTVISIHLSNKPPIRSVFLNLPHTSEPGCAVRQSGIDPGRLLNSQKMRRELDYLGRKADKRLMSETKARWKAIHKAMRRNARPGAKT